MPISETYKATDERLQQFQRWAEEPLGLYTTDPLLEYLEALEKRVGVLEGFLGIRYFTATTGEWVVQGTKPLEEEVEVKAQY